MTSNLDGIAGGEGIRVRPDGGLELLDACPCFCHVVVLSEALVRTVGLLVVAGLECERPLQRIAREVEADWIVGFCELERIDCIDEGSFASLDDGCDGELSTERLDHESVGWLGGRGRCGWARHCPFNNDHDRSGLVTLHSFLRCRRVADGGCNERSLMAEGTGDEVIR